MRCIVRWAPLLTLFAVPLVNARACTSAQLTALLSVANTYTSSPDCAGSALDTSFNTVAEVCSSACMKLIRQLEPDAPDCEYDGNNLGESMASLVSLCDAEDSGSTSSASAASASLATSSAASSATDSTTGSTISSASDTVPICSIDDMTLISELNDQAATSVDCLGSAGTTASAATLEEYCTENACVAYMTDVEAQLPNCTYGGYNLKQSVADVLVVCNDTSVTLAPSTTTPATKATKTLLPATTTQTPTAGSIASSQATDTPRATESAASTLASGSTATALVLSMALAFGGL